MKSYTDLEQSKKLAEILPIESADMFWMLESKDYYELVAIPYNESGADKNDGYPCWSLAALLNVIPKHIKDYNVLRIDISENDFAIWYDEIGYGVNNDLPNITMESAVDACYEMIIKLHEENLLGNYQFCLDSLK